MTIHWSLFALGSLLLLYPADRLLSGTVRLRGFDYFQSLENSPRHRPWWRVPLLWLDPLRGLFGTLLIQSGLRLNVIEDWSRLPKPAYAIMVAVLGLAVVCQTLTRRDQHALLAPIGFVAGILVALVPWPVAWIGLAMALTGLFAFRQFPAFFAVGFVTVAVLGIALRSAAFNLAPALGALALPLLAVLVTGHTLEIPTRGASQAGRSSSAPTPKAPE